MAGDFFFREDFSVSRVKKFFEARRLERRANFFAKILSVSRVKNFFEARRVSGGRFFLREDFSVSRRCDIIAKKFFKGGDAP
ncbi:MAG: hypothetical protein IKO05_09425 [Selenomonadaceae bacterium]|nr:hypothetical protein [Selenomonadaceae bacterium]